MSDNPFISAYTDTIERIHEIDSQMEPGASGRKTLNQAVSENPDVVENVRAVIKQVVESDNGTQAVAAQVFVREGMKVFKAIVDGFVNEHSTETVELSEEERAANFAEREKAQNLAVKLRATVAAMFGEDSDEFKALPAVPRKKIEPSKRGKRLKGKWSYNVDGLQVGTLKGSELATRLGLKNVKTIVEALTEKGLNVDGLPDSWTLTIGNHTVVAEREEGEDEETEDEEVESEEETD